MCYAWTEAGTILHCYDNNFIYVDLWCSELDVAILRLKRCEEQLVNPKPSQKQRNPQPEKQSVDPTLRFFCFIRDGLLICAVSLQKTGIGMIMGWIQLTNILP